MTNRGLAGSFCSHDRSPGEDRGKTVTKPLGVEVTWVGFERKSDSPSYWKISKWR